MAASLLGLPVSSTHILIGAVLGVGMVNKAANWNLMKPIGHHAADLRCYWCGDGVDSSRAVLDFF